MKKIFAICSFLLTASCAQMLEDIGCGTPPYYEQQQAKSLYGDLFSSRVYMNYEEGRKIFGCYYRYGDVVYSYSRLFDSGYVLVRGNQAITYRKAK